MKKWMTLPLALAMAATLACDRGDRDGTVGMSGTAAAERDFVEDQLADGNAEAELGRLAQERASSAEVREFAGMMIRDHRQAGEELQHIATRHKIQPETAGTSGEAMDDDHDDLRERLSKLSGAEFDREYIDAMVDDHQKAVDAVKERSEDSDNADVKQWAAKTLPTLRQHLERAKQIQDNLRNAGNRNQGNHNR